MTACVSVENTWLSLVHGYFNRKIFKGKCIAMVNYIEKLGCGMGKKAKVAGKGRSCIFENFINLSKYFLY